MDRVPSSAITCTPGVRSGKACLVGTRITVSDVLADFPDLRPEHIQAVLRYAAQGQ